MLIRAIAGHLSESFLGNIFRLFLEKVFKKSLKIFLKLLNYFVKVHIKNLPKICHFQIFPSPFTNHFTTLKQWLHGYYTTFESPYVNKIISYFEKK
jgi:hypothetical protein